MTGLYQSTAYINIKDLVAKLTLPLLRSKVSEGHYLNQVLIEYQMLHTECTVIGQLVQKKKKIKSLTIFGQRNPVGQKISFNIFSFPYPLGYPRRNLIQIGMGAFAEVSKTAEI